jgi:glycine betaine/proline transport system substrate-binding protein
MASLRLGRIDESFYAVVGGVVAEILRRHGYSVTTVEGTHTEVYAALGAGETDLAVAFWLPYGHAEPWKRLGRAVREFATLYDGAQFYWAIPDYVDERILSIADLATPELSRDIPREIRGLSLDATITTASTTAITSYGLDALDFRLEPGDFRTWEASLESAVAAKKSVILPLWKPYYLNDVYSLRVLADPKNVLGPANRVVLGARSDIVGHIDDATVEALQSTGLTIDIVSELDRRIHVDGQSPDEVAADWVARHHNSRR